MYNNSPENWWMIMEIFFFLINYVLENTGMMNF